MRLTKIATLNLEKKVLLSIDITLETFFFVDLTIETKESCAETFLMQQYHFKMVANKIWLCRMIDQLLNRIQSWFNKHVKNVVMAQPGGGRKNYGIFFSAINDCF